METGRGPRPDRFSELPNTAVQVSRVLRFRLALHASIRPSQSNDRRSLSIFREVRVRAPPVEMLWPREDTVEPEHFMLGEILGSGGFGRVHRAIAKVSGAELAIKILPASSDGLAIAKEVELLRACRVRLPGSELGPFAFRHALLTPDFDPWFEQSDHVVSYHGAALHETSGNLWILMECCEGSIFDVMAATKRCLTERQISAVVAACLDGLLFLHRRQIMHRDIKAANSARSQLISRTERGLSVVGRKCVPGMDAGRPPYSIHIV